MAAKTFAIVAESRMERGNVQAYHDLYDTAGDVMSGYDAGSDRCIWYRIAASIEVAE
jgi:hypothetical protein